MLATLENTEWLRCCPGPVAYAHRQGSVALRAKTKQPGAGKTFINPGTVPGSLSKGLPLDPPLTNEPP